MLYPAAQGAYLSTKLDCNKEFRENNQQLIAGYTTPNNTNGSANIVIIDANPDILKHELCHKVQYDNSRLPSCGVFNIMIYTAEFECYIAQQLPNRIYEKLYTEIPKSTSS